MRSAQQLGQCGIHLVRADFSKEEKDDIESTEQNEDDKRRYADFAQPLADERKRESDAEISP